MQTTPSNPTTAHAREQGSATALLPTVLTVTDASVKQHRVLGQMRDTGRRSLDFNSQMSPEWLIELEGGMEGTGAPSAALYVLSEQEARERAKAGIDVNYWGGYHAQVLALATAALEEAMS